MKKKKRYLMPLLFFLFVLSLWVRWTQGHEMIRSRTEHYTVIIREAPFKGYWLAPFFSPIGYLVSSGEGKTSIYEVVLYSNYDPVPITSFSMRSDGAWKTANIEWISSNHFVISFDNYREFGCKFESGRHATWRPFH